MNPSKETLPSEKTKKVFVITNGCPENCIDAARLLETMKINNWKETENYRDANLIFFNACANTQLTEDRSIEIIKQIKKNKKPSAELLVNGCLPKINMDRLKEVYNGITFGSDEIEKLSNIIATDCDFEKIHSNYLIPSTQSFLIEGKERLKISSIFDFISWVKKFTYPRFLRQGDIIHVSRPGSYCIKVSTGCSNKCSFCAIKHSRGNVRSKAIAQICQEFTQGLKEGYKEFALLGTDLGSFGRDLGISLVDLLNELIKNQGDYTIRLRNIHPKDLIKMMPGLAPIFKTGKISYLSSAIESGNNRILKLMNRGYTAEEYVEVMTSINTQFPSIQLRTQIMVGFPGETRAEYMDSLGIIDKINFDYVEIYIYSPRPNTKASGMPDQIPFKLGRKREFRLYLKFLLFHGRKRRNAVKQYEKLIKK